MFQANKGISTPIGILIIVVFAVLVGGILVWQTGVFKKESEIPEVKIPEEMKIPEEVITDETANWKTYRNEEYGFEVKYPEKWTVDEGGYYLFVAFRYREGCSFWIEVLPEGHADYNEPSKRKERGEKEKTISIGDNINGIYFDSVFVCSPPICPETLTRTIYFYKKDNLYRITRNATKDGQEMECINIFDQILSTFRFLE